MDDLASYPPSEYADLTGKYPHEPFVRQLKSVTANGDADFTPRPISVNGSPGTPANASESPIETADTGISKKSGPCGGLLSSMPRPVETVERELYGTGVEEKDVVVLHPGKKTIEP